jgi:hypothetical protein
MIEDAEDRIPFKAIEGTDRAELERAARQVLGHAREISIAPGIQITRNDAGRIRIDDRELGEITPGIASAVLDAAKLMAEEQAEAAAADPAKFLDPARNPWLPTNTDPGKYDEG